MPSRKPSCRRPMHPCGDTCVCRHSRYKLRENLKKFPRHKPRPSCRCDPADAAWIDKYNGVKRVKDSRRPVKSILFRGKLSVRKKDKSPVPGKTSGGTNRLGRYEYRRNAKGEYVDARGQPTTDEGQRVIQLDAGRVPVVSSHFPVEEGTRLYGTGENGGRVLRGTLVPRVGGSLTVELNYGQKKVMDGLPHVYAFSACIIPEPGQGGEQGHCPDGSVVASGWVEEEAIADFKSVVARMPNEHVEPPPAQYRGRQFYKACKIMGGIPRGNLKINPCVPRTDRKAETDYLRRPGDVVNILYSVPTLGGFSTDTVAVGTTFYRLREDAVPKPLDVPLYNPCDYKVSARRSSMTFVYGFIGDPDDERNRRYGWIAKDALCCFGLSAAAPPSTAPVGERFPRTEFRGVDGKTPYRFDLTGQPPPGLTLSPVRGSRDAAVLSGRPAPGTGGHDYQFGIKATDANGCSVETKQYAVKIVCPVVRLAPGSLPGGSVGQRYKQALRASGGKTPYEFSLADGALPDGLELRPDGTIQNTPTAAGEFAFTVAAKDANGCAGTAAYRVVVSEVVPSP